MKMSVFSILIALVWINSTGFSQNSLGKSDDIARISLTPAVSNEIGGMPVEATKFLRNKLQQVATLNGLGAGGSNPRFIITANIAILTKDIVPGPPPMIAQNLDITFYIADYQEKKVFSTTSISLKGVGTNETKAYIETIKNIKPASPDLKNFVETGKNKIMEYYNSNCDFIIKEGQTLADQKKYDEAIFKLASVPEVCKDCYMKVMSAIAPIYKQYMDNNCRFLLNSAKAAWMGNQNSTGADAAGQYLSQIDPEASCFNEAKEFMKEIQNKVLADEQRNWDFKMKQYDNNVSLESQRIEAYRSVGEAYGTHQPNIVYHFSGWLW